MIFFEQALLGLEFWIIVLLWVVFFYWPHKRYWEEKTRMRLFAVRDQLFDQAMRGDGINFDDQAYREARDLINGMIRFTHDFTALMLAASFLYSKLSKTNHMEPEMHMLEGLPMEGKKSILMAKGMMHLAMLDHVLHTSLFLWICMLPVRLLFLFAGQADWLKKRLRDPVNKHGWDVVDRTAMFYRS